MVAAEGQQLIDFEVVDALMAVQDIEIDMLAVEPWMIHHIHCLLNYQLQELRDRVSKTFQSDAYRTSSYPPYVLDREYWEYYKKHGIEGSLKAFRRYGYADTADVVISPVSKDQPLKIKDIGEVVKTCHMADARIEIVQAGNPFSNIFKVNANTTRIYPGSRLYGVEVQCINVNYKIPRVESLIRRMQLDFPVEEAVLTGKSLQVVNGLLVARAA